MRKHILLILLIALVLTLSSCQTSLSIPYVQPSNINMADYRNVAIASAKEYEGSQSLPFYIRYDDYFFDPSVIVYNYMTSYNFDSLKKSSAKEVTRVVTRLFNNSSYYSVLSTDKTDTYISLYKIGKDPSEMLRSEGIDALIVPKVTNLRTDEYIDTEVIEDEYTGEIKVVYTLYRYVKVSFSLTVLDTETNRIVAVKEYYAEKTDWESFDPDYYIFYTLESEADLVSEAILSKVDEIIDDFMPTRRYVYVTLKDNKPKVESVEEAYKAASDGNLDYALSVFKKEFESSGHVPSGYNAALILSSNGDIEGALEILNAIRNRGAADSEVNSFYSSLLEIKARNEKAEEQYKPKESSKSSSSVSPYSYLF